MQQIAALIEKFNNGTATAEEQLLLQAALQQQEPALQQWMQEAYAKDTAVNPALLSAEKSASLFRDIQNRLATAATTQPSAAAETTAPSPTRVPPFTAPVRRWYQHSMVWGAAASLLVIAVLAVLFTSRTQTAQQLAVQPATATTAPAPKQIHNTGKAIMHLQLEDNSTVALHPGSSLAYTAGFTINKRDIQLTGKALFTVATDKKRPFTVTARGIATTALGTQFLVNAQEAIVTVKLLQGKIVVRSADSSLAQVMPPVYLLPGQEAIASLQHHTCKVQQSAGEAPATATEPTATAGNAPLHYNRTPLIQVLQQLQSRYQITFDYNRREIQTQRFTGTLEPGDSLVVILNILSATTNLSFTQNNNRITIHKQP